MSDMSKFISRSKAALESFETALLTPITSGDLADWVMKMHSAWHITGDELHLEGRLHEQQFDEIANQDPELLFRVEQLRSEEAELRKLCEHIGKAISRLADHCQQLEPDEERARRPTQQIIDDGLALVLRVKRQNIAVQTWYNEAFNRDRGPVD